MHTCMLGCKEEMIHAMDCLLLGWDGVLVGVTCTSMYMYWLAIIVCNQPHPALPYICRGTVCIAVIVVWSCPVRLWWVLLLMPPTCIAATFRPSRARLFYRTPFAFCPCLCSAFTSMWVQIIVFMCLFHYAVATSTIFYLAVIIIMYVYVSSSLHLR